MSENRLVAIIGRPNVGKSTLFNRLIRQRKALVHDQPGVTRDRIEQQTLWMVKGKKHQILLMDTGGLAGEHFVEEVALQVSVALSKADVVLWVVNGRDGFTSGDQHVLESLRKSGMLIKKPVLLVVNKIDTALQENLIYDFYSLGIEKVLPVSAEHDLGIDDLKTMVLDSICTGFQKKPITAKKDLNINLPAIAVVGRPNVGKSTFVNVLLDQERMITSKTAGTTTDSVDSHVNVNGRDFILIDTAGIRRKDKTKQGVEVLSVVLARKALERADIAVLLLDGESGVVEQDEKIGGLIEKAGCSVILAVNKWDMQAQNKKFTKTDAAKIIRSSMAYLSYAPLLFISAKQRLGFEDLGDLFSLILEKSRTEIQTRELTDFIRKEAEIHNPKNAKFYMAHQISRRPPSFACYVNDPDKIHFSLKRHLVKAIRDRWEYIGTPIRLVFRTSSATLLNRHGQT
ncbi:MAG: ribosome biogenesis GTPase Der [Candidatus Poribacteria bacterium]